ncbi:MAG: type VI secretion system contractile sheath domain-containing protein [Planctomycetota bacterium]|jgi:type VI secretion system protein ImpC
MTMEFAREKISFELGTLTSSARQPAGDGTPFCVGILGDFSGRANRGLCETGPSLATRPRIMVDVDNIESLPTSLNTEIHVPVGGQGGPHIALRFAELNDFHPDRLFDRLELFQKLKAVKQRLRSAATFAEAASEVRSWIGGEQRSEPQQAEDGPESAQEPDADTIERLLGRRPGVQEHLLSERRSVDIDGLLREVVKPYIIPAPHPQQKELIAQIDRAIAGQMRTIVHHPDFQQLEATWLALHFLVSRVETDETLKIYILDTSKAELAADLLSANQVQSTGTYRLLVDQSKGTRSAEPWAILVGAYTFDQTKEDIELLSRLGTVAHATGAPFLAAASPHFAGCESLADTPDPGNWGWQPDSGTSQRWNELRNSPEATSIGLGLPRFLLRLPYGKSTESIEQFDFEELSGGADHEEYLWGNPAVVCACLLAAAFREAGWCLTNALPQELAGLPMHVYKSGGQTRVTPCAETFITERTALTLMDKGLIPLISVKGRDAVHVAQLQSVAKHGTPLSGRWR